MCCQATWCKQTKNCILISSFVCLHHAYLGSVDFSLHFLTELHCPALTHKMAVSANEPGTFMLANLVAAVLICVCARDKM